MTVLGIETSTAVCSVGLAQDGERLAERSLIESHIHSEKLLTLVQEILSDRKTPLKNLDAVAVSLGPGSFTGLRIGLSTAKGLCAAIEKPLIGVPTFAAASACAMETFPERRAAICVDAKQGEYYFSIYQTGIEGLQEVEPVGIVALSDLPGRTSDADIVLTDRITDVRKMCRENVNVIDLLPFCRGDMVAVLGMKMMSEPHSRPWQEMEPMYLKDFVIRTHSKNGLR
jgi:tRNA threonylcarbamoyladenosine biosynthesis protein TsaB